jgi:hypothetical protein
VLVEDVDFSDEFCRFVQTNLPTVEAAELLLAAFRDPQAPVGAGKRAEALRTAGLLDEALRYRPASDELARQVSTLAQAYEERPVTLVRLIYALRDQKVRSFAEAFKLRKN